MRAPDNTHHKLMDTDQSNAAEHASGFGRRTPAEIGVHLRNLASRRDNLTVQYAGGHLVTQLLDVDTRTRVFMRGITHAGIERAAVRRV